MRLGWLLLALLGAGWCGAQGGAAEPEPTGRLVAVLQSEAGLFEKARACQRLGEVGTAEAVPVLAALLGDGQLGAYARSGLEGIGDPGAAAALREALSRVQGGALVGVVDSLGVLRDRQATEALLRLAEGSDLEVRAAALRSLGRIADDRAVRGLRGLVSGGGDAVRAEAASGCLRAAEERLAAGQAAAAQALYDAVREAAVPVTLRAAATRGAILARRGDGVRWLMAAWRSPERAIRQAALLTVREMPDDRLADALNEELAQADAEMQVLMMGALADCHNARSAAAIRPLVGSADPGVRAAALRALGTVGGAGEAPVFLRVLERGATGEEAALAMAGLGRLPGVRVDGLVAEAMKTTEDPELRARLIRLLGERGAEASVDPVLQQAGAAEATVSKAAFDVLNVLARPGDLPELIRLTLAVRDDGVRAAAEAAVAATSRRIEVPSRQANALLTALSGATDPAARCSILRMLGAVGGSMALEVLVGGLADAHESVRETAFSILVDWPDARPIETLFGIVGQPVSPRQRTLALRGAIRMATAALGEPGRESEVVLGWLTRAHQAVRVPEEKKLLISGLGQLKRVESLGLLVGYLEEEGVNAEAGLAILELAPALAASHGEAVRAALKRVEATAANQDVRQKAGRLQENLFSGTGRGAP